jgi:nucleoside-diphosphate-sugar epimerase
VEENMKVLVTGATGFVGQNLVKILHEEGHEIRCLVRGNSKVDPLKKIGVELAYGELLNKASLPSAVCGIDIVYHLAGEVYAKSAKKFYEVNCIGTKNLLESCVQIELKKFIYLSSIAASGPSPSKDTPVNEESPCTPISDYGRSKYEAEKLVLQYYKIHKLPTIIIRAPIVYGPWDNPSSRVYLFLHFIKKGLFRTVGDGNNLISMCYTDNLIHGILLAAKSKGLEGEIYYIADERPYTINEIAKAVAREEGVKLSLSHIPIWVAATAAIILFIPAKLFGFVSPLSWMTIKEVRNTWTCDISKSQKELGYKPKIGFEEGVKRTVEWYLGSQINK